MTFLASMIEVPDSLFFEKAREVYQAGIRAFHLDVADGHYVDRLLDVKHRMRILKSIDHTIRIHTHLMVMEPMDFLYDYRFSNRIYLPSPSQSCIFKLIEMGIEPGIVVPLDSVVQPSKDLSYLVMGVPLGKGGQTFSHSSIETIKMLNGQVHSIELDGGITHDILSLGKDAGAEYFAGWSIIKDDIQIEVNRVRKTLSS